MEERAPELLGDFKKPSAPLVITCYHWFSSSVSWIKITPPFSYDIEYYSLTWLLDLLLSGIPTKILHKSLSYSSHATRFTRLTFPYLVTKNITKTDEENMLPQQILGCFCPAFQQLGYETDHSPPYSTQITNVVPYTYTLTHNFRYLYLYLVMCFSPFSCSLQLHSPKVFPSLTLCSQTPSAYWKFIK
jgi:hypothetical protein